MGRTLWLVVALIGCRATPAKVATEHVLKPSYLEPATGMMDAAIDLAGGNVGALVHVDRLRGHPTTWPITRVAGFGKLLDDLGLDPIFDVERVFVTAGGVVSCRPVIVIRHRLDRARVEAAFEKLLDNSREPGAHVEGLGFPAVRVRTRKLKQLVIAPRPDHIVMLPFDQAKLASTFAGAAPLPPPKADEVWFGWSNESGWPPFPEIMSGFSLSGGSLTAFIGDKHTVKLRGWARSQTEARQNAALLQKAADSVLKLPIIGAMIVDPIEFRANGDEVSTDVVLGPSEHEWILAHMTDGCW